VAKVLKEAKAMAAVEAMAATPVEAGKSTGNWQRAIDNSQLLFGCYSRQPGNGSKAGINQAAGKRTAKR
jgi:hypothetical protein